MKLIVLYGPENSGKTTTLKRLYETLKQHNVCETKCFKYYDSEHWHNDFRDLLVLDKSKPIVAQSESTSVKMYDGKNINDINKAFPDGDDVDKLHLSNDELGTEEKNVSRFLDSITKEQNHVSVGFILEGDYGFEHKGTCYSYKCRYRNLYWHLKEMRFCDIVICACSVLHHKDGSIVLEAKQKPVNCVIRFLNDYAITCDITFCVVDSIQHTENDWDALIKDDDSLVNKICGEIFDTIPTAPKKVFGKEVKYIGTVKSIEEFTGLLNSNFQDNKDVCYFYRGETKDYGETALLPQLFRNPKWVENEHKMINEFVAKFPDAFPKGTATFDIIVNADHFSLPSRVLDISYSSFTGLFMACYNFSANRKVDNQNDGFVYIFKVPKESIKNWTSDTVTLLSNLAIMKPDFPDEKDWSKSYGILMHAIKSERPDFYNIHEEKVSEYKDDFNKIVCVESKMLNSRIANQKGLFFLFGINGSKQNYKNMNFDDDVEIYSIGIDGNFKEKILNQLDMCGCNRMTMFPDMENVCKNISENYK